MKKITYSTDTFGNVKEHKCLVGLTNLINDLVIEDPKGRKKARYIAHLIGRYHSVLFILGNAKGSIISIKPNLFKLVFEDFRQKIIDQDIPLDLRGHIICFLTGLYRGKLREK